MTSEQPIRRKSSLGRRILFWLVGPLLIVVLAVVAVILNPPEEYLLGKLTDEIREGSGYVVTFAPNSSLKLWPRAVVELHDVKVRRPALGDTVGGIIGDASTIKAEAGLFGLVGSQPVIDRLEITKPTLTLHAADLGQMAKGDGSGNGGGGRFRVRVIRLEDGFASYLGGGPNPTATAHAINATLDDVTEVGFQKGEATFTWRDDPVKLAGAMARRVGDGVSDLEVKLDAPKANLTFKGVVAGGKDGKIAGSTSAKVASISETLHWFNVGFKRDLPALTKPATISGPLEYAGNRLSLKGADITTALAKGRADLTVDWQGSVPLITGKADWEHLDLAELVDDPAPSAGLAVRSGAARSVSFTGRDDEFFDPFGNLSDFLDGLNGNAKPQPVPPTPEAKPVLSTRPIDFSGLKLANLDLKQTAKSLTLGSYRLADVSLVSKLRAGRLDLDIERTKFAKGNWSGSFLLDGRAKEPELSLKMSGKGVDTKELQDLAIGRNTLEGSSDLDIDVSGRGNDLNAIFESAAGKGQVDVKQGRLIGFDLRAVLNQFWRKWSYDSKRTTPFDKVSAKFRVDKGTLQTIGPATMRGRNVEIDTHGSISFFERSLDQHVRARLAPPPSQLPIPVRISGLWSALKVSLDFGRFSASPQFFKLPEVAALPDASTFSGRNLRGAVRSLAPSSNAAPPATLSAELAAKIKRTLNDPAKRAKLPKAMRDALEKLAGQ